MEILKLKPSIKNYIWGGSKLKNDWNKNLGGDSIAECWELSLNDAGICTVAEGKFASENLSKVINESHYGTNCKDFPAFPTLIKLIDSKDNLSIQVHPSDSYALKNENQYGKSEMWYIVDCDEGAGIYCGFKNDITKEEYGARILNKTLTEVLNFIKVKKGESYFIPSGTVHAICKGITICEIQQNSNLTYRIYDYDRIQADGNKRELHIDKAKEVSILTKYIPKTKQTKISEGIKRICNCKYFTVYEYSVRSACITADKKSFNSVTFLSGQGSIENLKFKKGDTFFIPSGYGNYTIKGESKFLVTKVNKFFIGIDLGGTNIKGGIIDDEGNIIVSDNIKTESEKGPDFVIGNIVLLIKTLLLKSCMNLSDIEGVGICSPGMINSEDGIVTYSNNIKWENVSIIKKIEKELGIKARITNDANAAALGEAKFGAAKDLKNSILITLGTGVGGGIIIEGKLYEGNFGAGAELGHMVIYTNGEKCTCGRSGCLESYASATGLIRETKKAMEKNKNSLMWKVCNGNLDNVSGATAFKCKEKDAAAKTVVDNYIRALGEGLTNIANIFRPEVILLGGGVSKEGDNLIIPLQKFIDENAFGGKLGPKIPVKIAALGNNAGFFGAAALSFPKEE